jgi:hypothetical protein
METRRDALSPIGGLDEYVTQQIPFDEVIQMPSDRLSFINEDLQDSLYVLQDGEFRFDAYYSIPEELKKRLPRPHEGLLTMEVMESVDKLKKVYEDYIEIGKRYDQVFSELVKAKERAEELRELKLFDVISMIKKWKSKREQRQCADRGSPEHRSLTKEIEGVEAEMKAFFGI